MILLSNEPGEKSPGRNFKNYKKPALWIIGALAVLIITAGVIYLPDALKPPITSNISEPSGTISTPDTAKTQMGKLLTKDLGFQFLGSADGSISDAQMAAYAVVTMKNYNWETGNTREEYNAVTLKHFNKKLTDYTENGMTEALPGSTDRIRAVGWGYESNYHAVPRSLTQAGENRYVGQFYCLHVPYSFDEGWTYTDEQAGSMLSEGNWAPFVQYGRTFNLLEVTFKVGYEADGTAYPIYESVKILQTGLSAPLSSQ